MVERICTLLLGVLVVGATIALVTVLQHRNEQTKSVLGTALREQLGIESGFDVEKDSWWRRTRSPTSDGSSAIPGTPGDVPHKSDCAIRGFAYGFGKSLLPERSDFRTLYDALNLDMCPGTVRTPHGSDSWKPPSGPASGNEETSFPEASVLILFVDPIKGKDTHGGSKDKPLQTIQEALSRVAKSRASRSEVILREGHYYIPPGKPITFLKSHSGVTIRNSPNERAIITGGENIKVYRYDWDLVSSDNAKKISIWSTKLPKTTLPFEGLRLNTERMVRAKHPNGSPEQSQHSFRSSTKDQLFGNDGTYDSGWMPSSKDVSWVAAADFSRVPATPLIHAETFRDDAINNLAQFNDEIDQPDVSNKEMRGESSNTESSLAKPITFESIESGPKDWSGVLWPKFKPNAEKLPMEKRVFDPLDGTAGHGSYLSGSHGPCSATIKPPVGYFCSTNNPRGAEFVFRAPRGVSMKKASNFPSLNKDAVLVAWRGGSKGVVGGNPRWFAWTWRISTWKHEGDKLDIEFDPRVGGNQGAQGADVGDYFYVENVKDALDEPGEWYFDPLNFELFIVVNGTSTKSRPTGMEDWSLVRSKELVRFAGTQKDPVKNVAFVGVEFRDTALTWLEPHAMPSGGDWTLPRVAAIVAKGVSGLTIKSCLFERLDGSAIMLDGYIRNAVIEKNEFAWLGASAIVSWGRTSNCLNSQCTRKVVLDDFEAGPDGRQGNQPRGTKVTSNLFRELGVFVKQSAAYFSALSGQAAIEGNVMFNAPRSLINFNDGFLGGDVIKMNLLLNAVRESSDHGPINLWDRMPFIWEGARVREDTNSLFGSDGTTIPLTRYFERNFILANHASQAGIDSDDGASYIQSKLNVFVFGGIGLKSDFGGRQHESINDLYLFVQSFCFIPPPKLAAQPLQLTFKNNTCVLLGDSPLAYGSKCPGKQSGVVEVGKNRVVSKKGPLKVCDGQLLKDHLKQNAEKDPGTVELSMFPSDEQMLVWMSELLV